jgi:TolA-binding protein
LHRLVCCVPLLLSLSGCWAVQNTASNGRYTREVSLATLRVAQLEAALTEAESRVSQLEEFARLQGENEVSRVENLDDINIELNRLRGGIEQLTFQLGQLQADLVQSSTSSDQRLLYSENRLVEIEQFLNIEPPPMASAVAVDGAVVGGAENNVGAVGASVPEPVSEPVALSDQLDVAVEHLLADRSGVARALLQRLLSDNVGASELDEVRYRLAESHFNEKNWGGAARAFQQVVTNHPKSQWAPWAMLRQGECFVKMGQKKNANMFYEDLIAKYPKSKAATEAKTRL